MTVDEAAEEGLYSDVRRALVADDDPDINRLIAFRLSRLGFEVATAPDGPAAIATADAFHPDLLFLDISMPGMSGIDVLKTLRTRDLDAAIVMTTAFGSERIAIEAMRRGADDYLRKPFEPSEFRAVVERVTTRLQLQRENARLQRELVEKHQQLMAELVRAGTVQADLLPSGAPSLAGYEVAARCLPAREVGGDFYYWDVSPSSELDVAFGDVMGKGMPAALVMATVRAALRALLPRFGLADALHYAATSLEPDLRRSGSFVTLFLLRLDPERGLLHCLDAGHGLAFICRSQGSVDRVAGSSLPVGVPDDAGYGEITLRLDPGDTLVLVSDGLLEVAPEALDGKLVQEACAAESVAAVVEQLLAGAPPQLQDDLTVLALRRNAGQ